MTALPDPAHVPADGNAMAARAGKTRDAVPGDPGRAARLIADAERAVQSVTDEDDKPLALVAVAEALAAADPGRAARLITNAERVAQSVIRGVSKVDALVAVAGRWRPPTPAAPSASPGRSPTSTSRRQR